MSKAPILLLFSLLLGAGAASAATDPPAGVVAWEQVVAFEDAAFRLIEEDPDRARRRLVEVAALYLRHGSEETRQGAAFCIQLSTLLLQVVLHREHLCA